MKSHLILWVVISLIVGLGVGYFVRPSLESGFGYQAAVDESSSSSTTALSFRDCIQQAAKDGIITQAEFDACVAKFGKPKIYPDLGMYNCLNLALQTPPPPLPAQQVTRDEYNACYLQWWKLQGATG